jgi:glycine C-acetyltransferase
MMSLTKLEKSLKGQLRELRTSGRAKGAEKVIVAVRKGQGDKGTRCFLAGWENQLFIKMNSNSYLGLSLRPELIEAEETAAREFGVGPGAVRFISGTYQAHLRLEQKLAEFHDREAAMIFSSAYVTSMGVIVPLTDTETVIISDALNHNCIINAIRLSRPAAKAIYQHNDMQDLERKLSENVGQGKCCLVITDGIFSMRGDHAPLKELTAVCREFDDQFEEGVITIIDDSHGVGAIGKTGRGTEEYTGARVDIVVGTLGKAFGVNGGYVVGSASLIEYLRETAPMYIYSNPITVAEASAALKSIEIVDSPAGLEILAHLRRMTKKFESGLIELGYETIKGDHPVVPLMVRDTVKTADLVQYLTKHGILATGLNYPVVPKGDEEIRFQVCADQTESDIDYVLSVLKAYRDQ